MKSVIESKSPKSEKVLVGDLMIYEEGKCKLVVIVSAVYSDSFSGTILHQEGTTWKIGDTYAGFSLSLFHKFQDRLIMEN